MLGEYCTGTGTGTHSTCGSHRIVFTRCPGRMADNQLSACIDSSAWLVHVGGSALSCAWVAVDPDRRCNATEPNGFAARHACRMTCGECDPKQISIERRHLSTDESSTSCHTRGDDATLWSAANLLCASYSAPRVATCLVGGARTFTAPLVHQSIRRNFIEAFGGRPSHVFAVIKLQDARSDESRGSANVTHLDASEAAVHAALDYIGVSPKHARLLVNGTGSLTLPTPPCVESYLRGPAADAKRGRFEPGTPEQVWSLLGQLEGRALCHSLIEQAEGRNGREYDVVLLTRPDVMWPTPVMPYCMHDLRLPLKKRDWVFVMPRAEARYLMLTLHDRMRTCERALDGNKWLEYWTFDQLRSNGSDDRPVWIDGSARLSGIVARPDRPSLPKLECSTLRSRLLCERMTHRNPCMPP